MAHLIKIGNSQGIQIPRPLIEQAHLDGAEFSLKLVTEGILISIQRKPREGWEESIAQIMASGEPEEMDTEWLDASLTDDEGLEW